LLFLPEDLTMEMVTIAKSDLDALVGSTIELIKHTQGRDKSAGVIEQPIVETPRESISSAELKDKLAAAVDRLFEEGMISSVTQEALVQSIAQDPVKSASRIMDIFVDITGRNMGSDVARAEKSAAVDSRPADPYGDWAFLNR
jgi:hypothetical protein